MGNRFSGGGRDVKLSNGATDAFLSVLQFALSDLAVEPWERALAQWVAWHDQNLVGRGCVGFDLAEIEWDAADSAGQRAFLLRAVDTALSRHRWDELCYDPPFAERNLREYRDVVEGFRPFAQDRAPTGTWEWPGAGDGETLCPNHRVHCSALGWCRVCDDCGTAPPADGRPPAGGG